MEAKQESRTLLMRSLMHGLPLAALVLALLVYWFGIADRYIVFLYNHGMPPLYPDTSPFSRITASRYWMAGLVASGAVLVLYSAFSWFSGRMRKGYLPPPWYDVWLVCGPLFLFLIPAITMGMGAPPLPWSNAGAVTLAALLGVALALVPGKMAAERPSNLLWLAADGWGLALILITLAQLDDIGRWLSGGIDWRVILSLVILGLGAGWLLLLTAVRAWRGVFVGDFVSLALAAACVTYLFLPLLHHVFGSDGYFYISDSDNFFAGSVAMQLIAWGITAVIIWLLLALRGRLADRSTNEQQQAARIQSMDGKGS
ncbi:MAG: hypothetical protein ACK2U5_14475 [Candidatus Promineifilaceae bacterium]